jgi:uncharacterized membrane protein YesL
VQLEASVEEPQVAHPVGQVEAAVFVVDVLVVTFAVAVTVCRFLLFPRISSASNILLQVKQEVLRTVEQSEHP